ncbi:MAG: phosphoglycerate kinase [Synergistaceae bacterium]|nr:phosphoglycerate kinase [Synergistaceae bacterium]
MRYGILTLDDLDVAGRTVLCRVDVNQPVDKETGELRSTHRIAACVPTIDELARRRARVVLLAHQGSDIEYANFYTTRPHAAALSGMLGREVRWIDDVCGPAARSAIEALGEGEVLMLDNVRFCSEEQTLFEMELRLTHEQQARTQVVSKLAPLADLYVCDAFAAAHRDQPTLCGFEQLLPSAMGRLFEREWCEVSRLMEEPERPCVFVLGGAKISDAFMMMGTVLENASADTILTGGLVGNVLLAARGDPIGSGTLASIERAGHAGLIDRAREILARWAAKIVLPVDLAQVRDGAREEARVGEIPAGFDAVDVGAETAAQYREVIMGAKTVFVNGPLGVFERPESELGTRELFAALRDAPGYTVVGGGDSVTAAKKYAVTDALGYVCTGGGALIRFLSGEELPVVKALRHAAKTFSCPKGTRP